MTLLKDDLPSGHNLTGEFLYKYGDCTIDKVVDGTVHPFPSAKYKNVHKWIVDDGRLVIGWNENPSTGWSFPVLGELAFRRFYRATGLTLPLDTVHPTKIRLETHWNDDERVINEYQKFIDKLTSTISDSDVQMLEDVLAHQYQVGVSDECDNNAGEDL